MKANNKERIENAAMNAFNYGMRYWKKHVPCAVFCQIIAYIAFIIDLILPLLSALFVDYILNFKPGADTDAGIFSFLVGGRFGEPETWRLFFSITVVFAVLEVVREALIYFRNVLFQKNGLKFENELRDITYKKLVDLDSSTVSSYNTGELLTTLSSDIITAKEMYCRILLLLADSFFVIALTCVILATYSAWMLLLPAAIAPILVFALVCYSRAARRVSTAIRDCNANMNLTVQENIDAVRLIRSFANEDLEEHKFDSVNNNLKKAYLDQVDVSAKYGMIFNIIRQVAYIATIAIGTIMVFNDVFKVGIMTACVTFVLRIMDHLTQISNSIYQLQYGIVSMSRIMDFLEKQTKIPQAPHAEKIRNKPDIEMKNVSVTEDGKPLLKHINLSIPSGKKIGIMGGTGSGKSVLLKSLVRIYDVTEGSIEINGKDIRDYELDDLRNEFAYVFQDVFLFSDTIDANIAFYAPDIDREVILRAAEQAQASRFIKGLPQGFRTIVGERGLGLSGGQKQRISIARALLKNAPILVLDDASSALDVITERKLMASIKENYPDHTILIAAHRVSSIADCDEILYMQDGEIVERGTYDELIKKNGTFAEICRMQLAEDDDDSMTAIEDATSLAGGEA